MCDVTSDRWLSVDEIAAYLGRQALHGLRVDRAKEHAHAQGRESVEIQT